MHAHIVLAHPEPQSFNNHLTTVAKVALKQKGWSVSISDLYSKGFDPCSVKVNVLQEQHVDSKNVFATEKKNNKGV